MAFDKKSSEYAIHSLGGCCAPDVRITTFPGSFEYMRPQRLHAAKAAFMRGAAVSGKDTSTAWYDRINLKILTSDYGSK